MNAAFRPLVAALSQAARAREPVGRWLFFGRHPSGNSGCDELLLTRELASAEHQRSLRLHDHHAPEHTNGQSVTLYRDEVRDRIDHLTQNLVAQGVTDPVLAQHKAIAAIGATAHRHALILGFGDTFRVIGTVLPTVVLSPLKRSSQSDGGAH